MDPTVKRCGVGVSRRLLFALVVLWLGQGVAAATNGLDRARVLLEEESYDEALPLLEQVYARHPDSAVERDLALTYFHLGHFEEALPLLQRILAADPDARALRLALARSLLEMGRNDAARAHIDRLLEEAPDPEVLALSGRAHAAAGDLAAAAQAYRRALDSTPPPRLQQRVAAALVPLYRGQGRGAEARSVATEAIAAAPDSFDADALRLLLAIPERSRHDFAAHLHYRFEHDDNVRQEGDLPPLPGTDGGKDDSRHVLMADLLGRLGLTGRLDLFGEIHLYRSFHDRLSDYDQTVQTLVLGPGWSGDGWGLRLPLEYSRTDLDGEEYRSAWSAMPGLYRRWDDGTTLYGFVRLQEDDYAVQDPYYPEENRDGQRRGLGLMWRRAFAAGRGDLRVILEHDRDDADGANWEREVTGLYARGEYRFAPRLRAGLSYQYQQYDYDNLHSLFLERREDEVHGVSAWLAWAPAEHWVARLQGSYQDWGSNIDVFAYQRAVLSAGVSWHY